MAELSIEVQAPGLGAGPLFTLRDLPRAPGSAISAQLQSPGDDRPNLSPTGWRTGEHVFSFPVSEKGGGVYAFEFPEALTDHILDYQSLSLVLPDYELSFTFDWEPGIRIEALGASRGGPVDGDVVAPIRPEPEPEPAPAPKAAPPPPPPPPQPKPKPVAPPPTPPQKSGRGAGLILLLLFLAVLAGAGAYLYVEDPFGWKEKFLAQKPAETPEKPKQVAAEEPEPKPQAPAPETGPTPGPISPPQQKQTPPTKGQTSAPPEPSQAERLEAVKKDVASNDCDTVADRIEKLRREGYGPADLYFAEQTDSVGFAACVIPAPNDFKAVDAYVKACATQTPGARDSFQKFLSAIETAYGASGDDIVGMALSEARRKSAGTLCE